MNTRIYDNTIDLEKSEVENFWNMRATNSITLKSVLLGDDLQKGADVLRNNLEKSVMNDAIKDLGKLRILDLGCGIGRWAENLKDRIETYTGVDFSEGFIKFDQEKYSDCPNMKFYQMSVSEMDDRILSQNYNLIICTGVLVYVNDNELDKIFSEIRQMNPDCFYIQESVSLMDVRLTLDKFASEALKTNYSAIYRTSANYEKYFAKHGFKIIKSDLLLNNEAGGRSETNARWWVLK